MRRCHRGSVLEYGERSPERVTQRNGYRSRAWDTRVGTMDLHIPKLREGSYFPSLLEPRRRSERALLAVIQQAYVEGVSTRRVDDLVKALGCEGISKSQVVAHLSGTGRGGGWLHGPSAGRWTLPLPVAGRTDPEGQGGRQDSSTSAWWWRRPSMARASGRSSGWTWVRVKKAPSGWPSTLAVRQGPRRGGAGGIGRSSGTPRRHRRSLRRSQLATVPHPLHDQPAHSGPQARPAMGSHHGAHHLPATLPR